MSEFDDEEYESFELDGAGRSADSVKEPADASDEFDDDLDDDDDFDEVDLEDAADDEIDFVLAAYREDGQPYVQSLGKDLASDLDELIVQLRRLPGDAGALGFVSLVEEVFVITRVRGQHVQVLLSDAAAASDWPIARDVVDYLGEEPLEEDDEEGEPIGDLGIVADLGLSDFDMGAIIDNLDLGSVDMLIQIADKIKLNPQFRKAAEAAVGGEFSGLSQWDDSMRLALDQARMASMHGDVPVGAVAIDQAGSLLAAAGNEREIRHDPTAHAEILVLREASRRLRSWRLTGLTLVVTLEPCTMCAGAPGAGSGRTVDLRRIRSEGWCG